MCKLAANWKSEGKDSCSNNEKVRETVDIFLRKIPEIADKKVSITAQMGSSVFCFNFARTTSECRVPMVKHTMCDPFTRLHMQLFYVYTI